MDMYMVLGDNITVMVINGKSGTAPTVPTVPFAVPVSSWSGDGDNNDNDNIKDGNNAVNNDTMINTNRIYNDTGAIDHSSSPLSSLRDLLALIAY